MIRDFQIVLASGFLLLAGSYSAWAGSLTKKSLRQLIESGKPVQCTFSQMDPRGSQKGTVYVTRNHMRGDFTISRGKEKGFTVHTLRDEKWLYSWGGPLGKNQGTKIRVSALKKKTSKKKGARNKGIDLDQTHDMSCEPWKVSRKSFIPPKGVKFQDITAHVNQIQGAHGRMKQQQCGMCDQAPAGPGRTQCRKALGCS